MKTCITGDELTESRFLSAQKSRENEVEDDTHRFHFGYGGFHTMNTLMKVSYTFLFLNSYFFIQLLLLKSYSILTFSNCYCTFCLLVIVTALIVWRIIKFPIYEKFYSSINYMQINFIINWKFANFLRRKSNNDEVMSKRYSVSEDYEGVWEFRNQVRQGYIHGSMLHGEQQEGRH